MTNKPRKKVVSPVSPSREEDCCPHGGKNHAECPMCFTSPSQEEWEMEFDARFTHEERGFAGEIISREVNAEHLGDVKSKLFPEIKNFIALTISQARASTLKEVGEGVEALKRLPKLYFEPDYVDDHDECVIHNKAINAALEAVQTALQDKKLP